MGIGGMLGGLLPVVAACMLLLIGPSAAPAAARPALKLNVAGHRIAAETAATEGAREKGLMHRTSLPDDKGMIFVFPEPKRWCMWMLNTHIPLSAAFIDDRGTIVNVAEMLPQTTTHHCAVHPVRIVLEMNGGRFTKRNAGEGAVVRGLGSAPRGR